MRSVLAAEEKDWGKRTAEDLRQITWQRVSGAGCINTRGFRLTSQMQWDNCSFGADKLSDKPKQDLNLMGESGMVRAVLKYLLHHFPADVQFPTFFHALCSMCWWAPPILTLLVDWWRVRLQAMTARPCLAPVPAPCTAATMSCKPLWSWELGVSKTDLEWRRVRCFSKVIWSQPCSAEESGSSGVQLQSQGAWTGSSVSRRLWLL